MSHKTWLIAFGVAALVLIGGSGFYALSNFGDYSDSLESWDNRVGTIESLERRTPYPDEENKEALQIKVEEYEAGVESLYQSLNSFQRPLNEQLASTDFVQQVMSRVQEFRTFARDEGLEIENGGEFQLGFDAYSNQIPPQELVPYLDYELEAIDHLLRTLVAKNCQRLVTFERDPILGEPGGDEASDGSVVDKYPVRFRFVGSHECLQEFVNALANDRQFFYIVRVLKVRNEQTEGPVKLLQNNAGQEIPRFINSETQEMAGIEELERWDWQNVSSSELEARARAEGFINAKQDARVLFGQENLEVFMVVDIARFLSPTEVGDEEEKS